MRTEREYQILLAALAAASFDYCGGADPGPISSWINQGRAAVNGKSIARQHRERAIAFQNYCAERTRKIRAELKGEQLNA